MVKGEHLSDDDQKKIQLENEILKINLTAKYGESFKMETDMEIPAILENQFLRKMMAFEDQYANVGYITIYEKIGSPLCKPASAMTKLDFNIALSAIFKAFKKHDIMLKITDGPYPDKIIYQFITEELFNIKVPQDAVAGMSSNFIYEEFHPNHKAEIIKRTHTFLLNWFAANFTEYCTEISWHCVTEDGTSITREDVILKTAVFFNAFKCFKDDGYNIDNTSFELNQPSKEGMGFAEGVLKYDAEIDNGEIIHYEGHYKLYMQLEDGWWSIFHFVMPGFKW